MSAGMHMRVSVKVVPPSNVVQRVEYDGLFGHTFDAYDDALRRFEHAARIEVKVLQAGEVLGDGTRNPSKPARADGGRHAA